MPTYLPIRKSQVHYYLKTPLYIQNTDDSFILYKSENISIDVERFRADASPQLFIDADLKDLAFKDLRARFRNKLVDRIKAGDLMSTKTAICEIVQETLEESNPNNIQSLPGTIEIIYSELAAAADLATIVNGIRYGGKSLIEHSVNIMVLVINYCVFHRFDDSAAKKLCLTALLHDIGLTRLPREIYESKAKLSDAEFATYKTHPAIGHDLIRENPAIDPAVAMGVLEHHERLDGQGYPRGISNISFAGRLIGMIDCFDYLTNTQKAHRKKENPFGALKIIQKEMLKEGKFDKTIFRDMCLSLIGKRNYSDVNCGK